MMNKLFATDAPRATILIRLMVGLVFLSEGIQKFLLPAELGVGRFVKLGVPAPETLAPLVGITEIACGCLMILGLATRIASLPLLGVMTGAFIFTRIPDFLKNGFWSGLHGGGTDFSMLLGLLFLLIVGAGSWSLDAKLGKNK